METIRQAFGMAEIRALIARRWWLFLIPFLVIVLGSALVAWWLPDVYRAETVILVDPAKIPERYIAPISNIEVKDRLTTLSQQVMSRTRLEQVIRTLGLWREDWDDPAAMERRVNGLRQHIDVRVSGSDSFVIGFEGREPRLVQQITNQLASLFIAENSKIRAQRAEGTAQFIDQQRREMEEQLAAKEAEIRAYREAHLGELPEQKEANLRALDQLEQRLAANREATLRLTERRGLVQQQMASLRARAAEPEAVSPLRAELVRLHAELQALETQFTSRHPDVVMTRRRIKEIEAQMRNGGGQVSLPPAPAAELARDPMYVALQREFDQIRVDLASRAAERQELERQIQEARALVAAMPRREQEYATLTRDYENLKATYQSLLGKQIQAGMAEDLERKQAGETFTVLDPADVPKRPVKPDRLKILLVGLVLGLGAGAGGVYLGETLDQSVRTVEELKQAYGLPVLGAIPDLAHEEARARRRARRGQPVRAPQAARL
ncbi:MAG TPA: XrtA system polysaccharide chain length determinant [Thermodesulfobacteriota bacterium]